MKTKKNLIYVLCGIAVILVLAFKSVNYEPNYATAEVVKSADFYIFTDSKPIMPHDTLGVVDLGFVSGTQYDAIRSNLTKRARQKYPNADALILHLQKRGLDKCFVIKFK